MMSCDTNLLYAALDSQSTRHAVARSFLESVGDKTDFAVCELVLIELYGLIRNPALSRNPYTGAGAAQVIQRFRSHPRWQVLDYPGPQSGIMTRLWSKASEPSFPYRRVYDARLALTLRHHGVTDFATDNVKDFQGFGFHRVWDPLL